MRPPAEAWLKVQPPRLVRVLNTVSLPLESQIQSNTKRYIDAGEALQRCFVNIRLRDVRETTHFGRAFHTPALRSAPKAFQYPILLCYKKSYFLLKLCLATNFLSRTRNTPSAMSTNPQSQTRPVLINHQQSSSSSASSWASTSSAVTLSTPLNTSAPISTSESQGSSNARQLHWQQTQQSSLQSQVQPQQQRQPVQRTPSFDYRPEGAGRTATETNHYLSQAGLLAEAAKRAQMAVLIRDVEDMEF